MFFVARNTVKSLETRTVDLHCTKFVLWQSLWVHRRDTRTRLVSSTAVHLRHASMRAGAGSAARHLACVHKKRSRAPTTPSTLNTVCVSGVWLVETTQKSRAW